MDVLSILTLGLKPLYDKHMMFHNIINDFRNKLPRPQNQAKKLTDKDLESSILKGSARFMTVINLSTQRTSITEADIDDFYNRLNNFDYGFIIFKNYYRSYIRNLNRFNPKAEHKNFDLAVLQQAIKFDKLNPTKPIPILLFHFKYKYRFTSVIYLKLRSRKKKLKKN